MRSKVLVIAIAAIIVIGGITVIAHSNSKTNNMNMAKNTTAPSSQNAVSTDKVAIQNYAFSPTSIKVKVGTKVTWTNQDSVHHTVTEDSDSSGPKSDVFGMNQTYSYTYKTVGSFSYHCAIHPEMHGQVIVTN